MGKRDIMGKRAIIEALRHYFSTQPVLKAWLTIALYRYHA